MVQTQSATELTDRSECGSTQYESKRQAPASEHIIDIIYS
jgi:hypothetical protein